MPRNLLGTPPSSNNLSIPRACIFVSDLRPDDRPVGNWRDMGAVSSADITFSTSTIEHYTSCGEQRVRDAEITTEISAELSLSLDHLLLTENQEILHNALTTDMSSAAQSWTNDRVGALIVPNPNGSSQFRNRGARGYHFKIWADGADRVYAGVPPANFQIDPDGAGGSAAFTVPQYDPSKGMYGVDPSKFTINAPSAVSDNNANNGGVVSLTVAQGDFTINGAQGTLFVPATGNLSALLNSMASAVTGNPDYLAVNLEYEGTMATSTAPPTIHNIEALATTDRSVAIRFEMQDLASPGYRRVVEIHKVRLRPTGSVNLVSDGTNFSTGDLSGTIEKPTWKDGTDLRKGFYDIREVQY